MKNIEILLCPFDNGIRSMLRFKRGITGADKGPETVRYILSPISFKFKTIPVQKYNTKLYKNKIFDVEFRKLQKDNTLKAHKIMQEYLFDTIKSGYFPITIGGDHSITYPLVKGISEFYKNKKIGVIYIDAHFDMRPFDDDPEIGGVISSGNAFRRIIEDENINCSGKNIAAIGIHDSRSNTYNRLYDYAVSKSVKIFFDSQVKNTGKIAEEVLEHISKNSDIIYLSIDIDAVNLKYAPGVSAPASKGISKNTLYKFVEKFTLHPKLKGVDIAEISSRETAWYEILEDKKREESVEEKNAKLEKTGELGAEIIKKIAAIIQNEK